MCADEVPAIVVDNGSSTIKAGLSGSEKPEIVLPTIVGKPREGFYSYGLSDSYIGDEALKQKHVLNYEYPLQRGLVTNWDDMEKVWRHVFHDKLKVSPEDHHVLLTETPGNPMGNKEKMTEIMFEEFNTPALYIAIPAVLSLCASGRTTGLVVDCGGGVSNSVPVYEGYSLPHATSRCSVAGCDLTEYLTKLLERKGVALTNIADTDKEFAVRDIKEKLCYVAEDITREKQSIKSSSETTTCELPDGAVVTLSEEQFLCPEVLFQPSLLGSDSTSYDPDIKGIHRNIMESVTRCDTDIRADMLANLVLSGGSTKFTGFAQRLHKELDEAVSSTTARVKIDTPKTEYSAWTGGSALASFLTTQRMWVTRQEYEESGTIIVHQKCF